MISGYSVISVYVVLMLKTVENKRRKFNIATDEGTYNTPCFYFENFLQFKIIRKYIKYI